jgi:hypothetical protein
MPAPEDFYAEDGWHSVASLRAAWPDAEQYEDYALEDLLETAKLRGRAHLGGLDVTSGPTPQVAPANYRMAQAMDARDLAMGGMVARSEGEWGDPSAPMTFFPMSWLVKATYTPPKRVPHVG